MSGAVDLEGAARFEATCHAAARELDRLDPGPAVDIILRTAAGYAPKRTGRLAGSLRPFPAEGAAHPMGSTLPYAGAVHNGWAAHHIRPNPFLTRAGESTEPMWAAAYADTVERDVLGSIRGV